MYRLPYIYIRSGEVAMPTFVSKIMYNLKRMLLKEYAARRIHVYITVLLCLQQRVVSACFCVPLKGT
jgi:hypothetical protein